MKRFAALTVAACLALASCSAEAAERTSQATAAHAPQRPNIIFVLADDLAGNLVDYMPTLQSMQRQGTTFSDYFVTDSLCCPSRSTTFTGEFPHNTGVFTNGGDDGGVAGVQAPRDQRAPPAPPPHAGRRPPRPDGQELHP